MHRVRKLLRPLDHESYVKNPCLPGPKIRQPSAGRYRASGRLRAAAAAGSATLAILLMPFAAQGSARAPEMAFTRLGSSEGLSPGAVRTIVQDAQGFVWFGTEDGLDRYDGYELRHFSHRRSVPGTLPNNWISALARDATGRLWVGSDGGGLVWLDDSTGTFRSEDPQNHQPLLDPMGKVRALHVDRSGRLWIATRNAGMRGIDMLRHTSTVYRHDAAKEDSLSDDSVYAMAEDDSGSLWVGTSSGLDRLDPQSGRIEHLARELHSAGVPANDPLKVNAMCVDRLGNLWIALDTGLARLNLSTGSKTLMRHHDGDPDSLPAGAVTALLEDNEQRLWVGTTAGLALLDRPSGRFRVIRHDPASLDSLPDSNISLALPGSQRIALGGHQIRRRRSLESAFLVVRPSSLRGSGRRQHHLVRRRPARHALGGILGRRRGCNRPAHRRNGALPQRRGVARAVARRCRDGAAGG